MNRKARIELVERILTDIPETRTNNKLLCVEVWKAQGCESLDDITKFGSSPSGITRDRRREHILVKFPRSEVRYKQFVEYRNEMSGYSGTLFNVDNTRL